jgi:hypothetical protein
VIALHARQPLLGSFWILGQEMREVLDAMAGVFAREGLLLQADGEPTGNGIETSMDVEFSVDVRKKMDLDGPRVENAGSHARSVSSSWRTVPNLRISAWTCSFAGPVITQTARSFLPT